MNNRINLDRLAGSAMFRVFGASGLAFVLMLGVAVSSGLGAVETAPKTVVAMQIR